MTEAEELEFLTLKRRRAQAAPSQPSPQQIASDETPKPEQPGSGEYASSLPQSVKTTKTGPYERHPMEQLGAGLTASGLGSFYGIKDLVSEVSDEERAQLEKARLDANDSIAGLTGQVVGDVAQLALPGAGAARLVKAAQLAKPAALAAGIGTDVALSAGHGGLSLPSQEQSRAENALASGVGAGVGGALAPVLKRVMKGLKPTEKAQKLLDEGVYLTPGQASDSGIARGSEFLMSMAPFLAKGTKEARGTALKQWNKKAMQLAAPIGKRISETGIEGGRQLKSAFDDAYASAWSKAGKPTNEGMVNVVNQGIASSEALGKSSHVAIRKVLDSVKDISSEYTPKKLKALDNLFRKEIKKATGGADPNIDLADALGSMRQTVRGSVSDEAQEALKAVDSQYGKFLTVKKAGANAAKEGGQFTPAQLMNAAKSVGGETKTFTGRAPLQEYSQAGIDVLEEKLPNPIMDFMKAGAQVLPSPTSVMKGAGNVAIGQTKAQKNLDKLAAALRKRGVGSGIVAGAIEQPNE